MIAREWKCKCSNTNEDSKFEIEPELSVKHYTVIEHKLKNGALAKGRL